MPAPDPRTDLGIVYVAVSSEMLVELAEQESEPLVVVGIKPDDNGGFNLLMRRPTKAELQLAVFRAGPSLVPA